jgi:hypothetical protein
VLGWENSRSKIPEHENEEWLLTPVDEVMATLPKWTPEQLEQAIKDLESLPNWQDWKTTLTIIQYTLLDLISVTNDLEGWCNSLPIEVQEMAKLLRVLAFDWNLVAKELNSEIKAYGELMKQAEEENLDEQFEMLRLRQPGVPNVELRMGNPEEMQIWMLSLMRDDFRKWEDLPVNPLFTLGRSKMTGMLAGHLLVTWAAGELYRLQLMEESRCQALRFALALERYHRENQKYPDSLEELPLKEMSMNVHLEYEKQGEGYRIQNKVFSLEKP